MKSDPDSQRLRQVVAAYGADPRRWPEDERQGLVDAAKRQTDAGWMVEARNLDRVLDCAPSPLALDNDLTDAILARAAATPQIDVEAENGGARVVEFAAPAAIGARRMPGRRGGVLGHLPEAAILAASLLIGIWAGENDVFDSELFDIGIVVGLSGSTEEEVNFINALVGINLTDNEDLL